MVFEDAGKAAMAICARSRGGSASGLRARGTSEKAALACMPGRVCAYCASSRSFRQAAPCSMRLPSDWRVIFTVTPVTAVSSSAMTRILPPGWRWYSAGLMSGIVGKRTDDAIVVNPQDVCPVEPHLFDDMLVSGLLLRDHIYGDHAVLSRNRVKTVRMR